MRMYNMKISKGSYSYILSTFQRNIDKINEYAPKLKKDGKYNDFEVRLAWDCLRAFIGTDYICDVLYNKEGLNGNHITTAGKRALKELKVI